MASDACFLCDHREPGDRCNFREHDRMENYTRICLDTARAFENIFQQKSVKWKEVKIGNEQDCVNREVT